MSHGVVWWCGINLPIVGWGGQSRGFVGSLGEHVETGHLERVGGLIGDTQGVPLFRKGFGLVGLRHVDHNFIGLTVNNDGLVIEGAGLESCGVAHGVVWWCEVSLWIQGWGGQTSPILRPFFVIPFAGSFKCFAMCVERPASKTHCIFPDIIAGRIGVFGVFMIHA